MPRPSFACPECGEELNVAGLSPGRDVRCPNCGTAVEVPYLPRSTPRAFRKGKGDGPPWALRAAWGFSAIISLLLVAGLASKLMSERARAGREARVLELLTTVERLEKAERYDQAFIEAEAAVGLAKAGDSVRAVLLDTVLKSRDRVSRLDARKVLESVDRREPRRAVGDCLVLRVRAERDPALRGLSPEIEKALSRSLLRQVEADLAAAAAAHESGRAADALGLLEEADRVLKKLPESIRTEPTERTTNAAVRLVSRYGVEVAPVQGRFQLGSVEAYEEEIAPRLRQSVVARGYLLRPAKSPFRALWDEFAPYRLTFDVEESFTVRYLHSENRISQIHGQLKLLKEKRPVWLGEVMSRTRVPLEGVSGLKASRLAGSEQRSAEAERLLYQDAFTQVNAYLSAQFRGLPDPSKD